MENSAYFLLNIELLFDRVVKVTLKEKYLLKTQLFDGWHVWSIRYYDLHIA